MSESTSGRWIGFVSTHFWGTDEVSLETGRWVDVLEQLGHTCFFFAGRHLVNELNKSMKMIRYARDEFQLDLADICARERPPIITGPEYRKMRGYATAVSTRL